MVVFKSEDEFCEFSVERYTDTFAIHVWHKKRNGGYVAVLNQTQALKVIEALATSLVTQRGGSNE